jgi:uncharacterized membrane protein
VAGWRQGLTDERVEQLIGSLLRAGVIIAAVVVLAGGAEYLLRHGGEQPHYRIFRGEPADLRSIGGILRDTEEGRSTGLIQLGLVLLAFALERDRLYVVVTLVVLAILAYSIGGGFP